MRKSKSASLCLAFVALAFFLASCGAGEGGFYFPSARTGGEQLKEKSKMEIWAHRGCSYCYPENTLQAFKAAAALPVTGIEFDVQLTKDKKVVVIHDERVDRTTDGNGNVRDFTLQELQALKIKAPSGFERVPTLEEVLELLKPYCLKKNLRLNIELKTSRVRYEGIEEMVMAAVRDYGLEERVVYSSFLPESIALVKEKKLDADAAILKMSLQKCLDVAEELAADGKKIDGLHPSVGRLDVYDIRKKTALPIRAYGSAEPFYPSAGDYERQDLDALMDLGVTGIFTNVPEYYCAEYAKTFPRLDAGAAISYDTGLYKKEGGSKHLADFNFYEVNAGDKFCFGAPGYLCQLAFYDDAIDPKYIHTYCYSPEESWANFTFNLKQTGWRPWGKGFGRHGWARVLVRRLDGKPVGDNDKKAVQGKCFFLRKKIERKVNPCFEAEIADTAKKANALKGEGRLALALITDNHYVINGRWEDTAANLRAVNKAAPFDALVHLGDFTDGMTSAQVTREYFGRVHRDLRKLGVPLYYCLGNHDSNYFRKNPEPMDLAAQSRLYLGRESPNYYVDFADKGLRLLFIHSYDHTQEGQSNRYGFSDEDVEWTRAALAGTPAGCKAIVFSHCPLLAKMHYWSEEIRNEAAMVKVLEDFNAGVNQKALQAQDAGAASGFQAKKGRRLLAFIHGHIHADWVNDTDLSFPVIAIGCAKIEDDQVKKSAGSTTYSRALDDASQDLWDVLLVDAKAGRLDFVRFGAGVDRRVGE